MATGQTLGSPIRIGRLRALFLALVFVATSAAQPAAAALRLPHLFSDHAVLQRDRPVHVWGWATPGAEIDVKLGGHAARAQTDRLGHWNVWLAPMPAGGPYSLAVQGDAGSQSVHDIMLGDVWFASGQSNMEMPLKGFPTAVLKDSAAEIAAAANPRIRLLKVEHRASDYPLGDIDQTWTLSTPATAADFSAVAYFFAREIAAREHVTVGVIDSSWGGTPADSWVSMDALGDNPALWPAFAARAHLADSEADKAAILQDWSTQEAQARSRGVAPPAHDWRPPEESWRPAALYNAMVAPFTGYGIKGVIWYQGETNSRPDRAPYYEALFKGLITDWRTDFAQGDFPFLYAQISSFYSPSEEWGLVRDAQRRALALRNTAMAVTTDVGDPGNVHPADKQTVAARLALAARGLVYGEDIAYLPPLFRQATGAPGGMRVWFDHADKLNSRGAPLGGFEIAGADHHFAPATAVVDHDTVLVTGPMAAPAYVRFNWAGVAGGELYNAAGLPAPTFTSEPRPFGHMVFP